MPPKKDKTVSNPTEKNSDSSKSNSSSESLPNIASSTSSTTLGSSTPTTTLGAPPTTLGATLGAPPTSLGATLGGPPTTLGSATSTTSLGGPPASTTAAVPTSLGAIPTEVILVSPILPDVPVSNEKKKKTTEDKRKTEDKKKAEEKKKEGAEAKRKAIAEQIKENLRRQKEEEERLQRELEERIKQEEDEEKKRIEEEKRLQAIKDAKKKKEKEKEKERKKRQEEEAKLAKIEQLKKMQGVKIAAFDKSEESKESRHEKRLKQKKHHQKEDLKDQQQQQQSPSEPLRSSTSSSVQTEENKEENKEEEKKEEQILDTWEDADVDEIILEKSSNSTSSSSTSTPSGSLSNSTNVQTSTGNSQTEQKISAEITKPLETTAAIEKSQTTQSTEADKSQEFRSPICVIMGHVDTGKTSLLDKIRHTNVQGGEAGGITQQIGATFFPIENLKEQAAKIQAKQELQYKIPGLLIIDTPGHESFSNLRSRGSSLCDIAILVVDLMHALEPQTIESINMLRSRNTPFIVALNKIDAVYGWQSKPWSSFQDSWKRQNQSTKDQFQKLSSEVISGFAAQGLNSVLYHENKDFRKYVSLIPTSARTGEGIPDLLYLLIQLTQKSLTQKLFYQEKLQCTILEVKVIEGFGTTIDVILVNGELHEGDSVVVCGMNGPIVTKIRALLTPQPLKELRVKGQYVHHKVLKAAQGVKIAADELDKAVPGSALLVYNQGDDLEQLKDEVMADYHKLKKSIEKSEKGVYVQASTLGSLEALLEFLKTSKIPVFGINIGPVNKKDVMHAAVMTERAPEYAIILAFDVKVSKDAEQVAQEMGVKIFTADIIYHLFDKFTVHINKIKEKKKEDSAAIAVFPCRLKILKKFNATKPIVLGVEVVEGTLRIATPIAVPSKQMIELGRVTSIEDNHKPLQKLTKGNQAAIKIEFDQPDLQRAFGKHFDESDELVSRISRQSIDAIKEHFRDDLEKEDVQLLAKLKRVFGID